MGKRFPILIAAAAAVAVALALTAGVAGAKGGGNSANAKKCQKTGYLSWVTAQDATFDSAGACTAYAAQGGTLTPKPVTHQLGVSVAFAGGPPPDAGRVTSDPAGIDCVADASTPAAACFHDFTAGTSVTLTAEAVGGAVFIEWSGDGACDGQDATCTLTMDQGHREIALFD